MTIRHLTTFDAVLNATGGLRGLADLMGVTKSAVCHQRRGGKFPARWFDRIETALAPHGLTVARGLFDFEPVRTFGGPVHGTQFQTRSERTRRRP